MTDDRAVARREMPAVLDGTCRVCGRPTEETSIVGERRIPLCGRCQRIDCRYRVAGDVLQMVNPSTGELLAEHPLVYTDQHFREMSIEGRLGEWIQGASLEALSSVWEIAEQDRQRIQEIKYRIAATLHRRLGFYGGQWQVHAARILRHNEDVVRTYAYIWERLGEQIEADPRLMELGYDLLRHAAFADEPAKKLERYAVLRDVGKPVKQILAEESSGAAPQVEHATTSAYGSGLDARGRPIPALCRHEFETRCRHCGMKQQEVRD